uniref:Reverse transcriptase-rnase h-integrase n=1 Tax=Moniliophthora roreri TaxID=221103 RepID=A0A0W0FPY7_MONRR
MAPIEDPHLRPPLTPEVFRRLKHQFHPDIEVIPPVGGEGLSRAHEVKDEEQENRTPLSDKDPLMLSLRPPTPLPTPMTLLVNCISALCADWNTISPEIAHSTCVGLAALRTEGLVRVQTLCQMIMIMMMNLTTISEENAEESIHNSRGDADFLFVGADPQKVQRFEELPLVSEQVAAGWQPTLDVPATPVLQSINEMPDTSYDYNTELYGDGES